MLQYALWQRGLLARIARVRNHLLTVQCSVLIPILLPEAALAEDSSVGSPHRMVINLVAVILVAEALGEVVANLQEMVPAGEEVLASRTTLPPTRVMDTPTSAIIVSRILFGGWMQLTSEKLEMFSNPFLWEPLFPPRLPTRFLC